MALRRNQKLSASFAGLAACTLAAVFGAVLSTPGAAQDGYSRAVVQPVPPAALGDLNAALRDLGRNPRDLSALLRAGEASIELDDLEAAQGFFRRAEAVAPADGRVKAGLASVLVRLDDPVAAVVQFAQAEASGAPMAQYAADRGLAHDLVGENVRAQQLYREALARENDPEVTQRLALSQAIMGDQRGSEATLLPLLQRQDLAAYRTRAFALAILGKGDEAVSIAETILPKRLSNRMAPYLRYMPRLTRAQQAAAANLGRFPRASEIGRDDPKIAAYAGTAAPQVAVRTPDSRLVPAGEPLGNANRAASSDQGRANQSVERVPVESLPSAPSPSVQQPVVQPIADDRTEAPPAAPQQQVVAAARTSPAAGAPASVQTPAATGAQTPAQAEPVVVARLESPSPAPTGVLPRPSLSVASPAAESSEQEVSLSEAFAAFTLASETENRPARGAVDITSIQPPREKPEAEEPKPPAHPPRYWVQVATGRDVAALAFDWRRIKRTAGELLADREGFTAEWGQTNRLVTGPYASAGEAQKVVTELEETGVDSFPFTSADGEEVVPLK